MAADARKLQQRYEALRTERSKWDAAWRPLAELFSPMRWQDDGTQDSARTVINARLVDSTGVLDMRTLAAGMHGGMTSPARQWFRLVMQDDRQEKNEDVRIWLDDVAKRMNTVFHRSNLYNALHTLYADIGVFGTALMIEMADNSGVRFVNVKAGEYVLDVNPSGQVDTFFRRIGMTPRQIVAEFGVDSVPRFIAYLAGRPDMGDGQARYDVIHGVFPREDGDIFGVTGDRMPYASVYWMLEGDGKSGRATVLRESGFREFPAFAPRWDAGALDVYGRSPAMDVLPDCRMLQGMVTTLRKMQHKIADPPLAVDASLVSSGVELTPGGLNYVQSGREAAGSIVPIQQPEPAALNYTMQGIHEVRQIIHDGLYADLFRMMIEVDRKQITATEVDAREQEKMILIGPVVERLQHELLAPLISRTFSLMLYYGVIPNPPDAVRGAPLRVEFESVLARAQRMLSTSALDQFAAFAMNTAQAFPELLDGIDSDRMLEAYANYVSLEQAVLRGKSERDVLRTQRAQAQAQAAQEQQEMAAAKTAADMSASARNLGQATLGPDGQTALETLVSGMGGMTS